MGSVEASSPLGARGQILTVQACAAPGFSAVLSLHPAAGTPAGPLVRHQAPGSGRQFS